MRNGLFACLFLTVLTACSSGSEEIVNNPQASSTPQRIVSLDYCADQYVLALADRDQIAALSTESQDDFSYLRGEAAGIPQVLPRAELVLALKPDLIIRSFGGGPQANALFDRAGIPVVQLGWTNDFDALRDELIRISEEVGAPEKGQQLADEFDQRLAAIQTSPELKRALYMTPGGVTSGTGSLIDQMFIAAGLTNYQDMPGWHDLPLERLLTDAPDIVAAAFYDSIHKTPGNWSSSRHPIALDQLKHAETVPLNGAWTSCGAWYLIEAIEALAEAGQASK